MDRFDKNGMMIIPDISEPLAKAGKKQLVVKECFCPNGHSLIDSHASFNGYPGIILGVRVGEQTGTLAISPIHGQKSWISTDIKLNNGEEISLFCPQCQAVLPAHSQCDCGSNFLTIFLTTETDFSDCVGICQRIGCPNSTITTSGKLLTNFQDELL